MPHFSNLDKAFIIARIFLRSTHFAFFSKLRLLHLTEKSSLVCNLARYVEYDELGYSEHCYHYKRRYRVESPVPSYCEANEINQIRHCEKT
jgi:hypothetical protein